jgi:hypothetical protein
VFRLWGKVVATMDRFETAAARIGRARASVVLSVVACLVFAACSDNQTDGGDGPILNSAPPAETEVDEDFGEVGTTVPILRPVSEVEPCDLVPQSEAQRVLEATSVTSEPYVFDDSPGEYAIACEWTPTRKTPESPDFLKVEVAETDQSEHEFEETYGTPRDIKARKAGQNPTCTTPQRISVGEIAFSENCFAASLPDGRGGIGAVHVLLSGVRISVDIYGLAARSELYEATAESIASLVVEELGT